MGTLPTPEKTWQYAHVVAGSTGTAHGDLADLIYQTKNALKAFGLQPWTCAGSNDGSTAAMDGVDRWTSGSVITFTGTTGATWIVMQAPAGWGHGQMLMYCDNGGSFGANVHVKWSLGGLFTGGTTTTIPTATDEDGHTNQNLINFSTLPTGGVVTCNILHSSDGQHTRMFFSTQNVPAGFICTETAGSPGSLWTDPRFYARGPNGDLNPLIPPWVFNTIQVAFRGKTPAGNFGPINVLRDEVNESLINEVFFVPNEISGDVPLFTVGLYSPDVVGFRGRMGYLKDWWYTVNSVNPGDGFPGDASKQFIAIHTGVVVPWDGTTIVLG